LQLEQVAAGAGDAEHVAEGAERDVRPRRDGVGPVDRLQRGHTHRAARPVDEFHPGREQPVDAVLDDGVGLPAAHLHDRPRPGDGAGDRTGQRTGGRAVAVLVHVLHGGGSSNSPSWFNSPRRANTLAASASSIRDRANPTWTRTYSPGRTSGTCSRHTRLRTPPNSTLPMSTSCS